MYLYHEIGYIDFIVYGSEKKTERGQIVAARQASTAKWPDDKDKM